MKKGKVSIDSRAVLGGKAEKGANNEYVGANSSHSTGEHIVDEELCTITVCQERREKNIYDKNYQNS